MRTHQNHAGHTMDSHQCLRHTLGTLPTSPPMMQSGHRVSANALQVEEPLLQCHAPPSLPSNASKPRDTRELLHSLLPPLHSPQTLSGSPSSVSDHCHHSDASRSLAQRRTDPPEPSLPSNAFKPRDTQALLHSLLLPLHSPLTLSGSSPSVPDHYRHSDASLSPEQRRTDPLEPHIHSDDALPNVRSHHPCSSPPPVQNRLEELRRLKIPPALPPNPSVLDNEVNESRDGVVFYCGSPQHRDACLSTMPPRIAPPEPPVSPDSVAPAGHFLSSSSGPPQGQTICDQPCDPRTQSDSSPHPTVMGNVTPFPITRPSMSTTQSVPSPPTRQAVIEMPDSSPSNPQEQRNITATVNADIIMEIDEPTSKVLSFLNVSRRLTPSHPHQHSSHDSSARLITFKTSRATKNNGNSGH
ncbi:hypothetical protein JVT61DRAFT_3915 [Boletus reticuloceps]|uniref:Uncharacterized protein n=1 Tax=Boletus reticuloceps TaxID=495285 RepID=A0A8I2YMG4_9AGAM|nr:hypothetical protein JVT61DRAFT_3915 [Boletus reticuloceps]